MPRRFLAPLGRPFGLPLCPGLKGTRFLSFFSVPAVTDLPRVLAISPSEFMLCSQHKIAKLSRGSIPFFPTTRFKEVRMKWLLLLTILSGYSGSSTVAANFDSKDVCEAAAKSTEDRIERPRWMP